MCWGNSATNWVRPLRSILVIFDRQPVVGSIGLGTRDRIAGLRSGSPLAPGEKEIEFVSKSTGHRFLAPEPFTVKDFADYKAKLRKAKVILDPAERRRIIAEGAAELAAAEGLTIKDDPGLLDEVTGLVEWPVPLMGVIDEQFMSVPAEVLTTSMRTHQKYFSLLDKEGNLAPRFIVVANTETGDGGKTVTAGNERVLRARLADAKFFWDQDRKESLAGRVPALNAIIFHKKLGSLGDKIDRVGALAAELTDYIPGADKDRVRSAARLAKADLTTEMVGEFPELQGIMGRYYALDGGEHAEVAQAVAEHYSPLGPNDACPTAPVSVAVSLADKIDTLVGFFAIGELPTGSKDPYALRRAALGVIRLIIENGLRLPLRQVFSRAQSKYFKHKSKGTLDAAFVATGEDLYTQLLDFFADRLKVHLREKGVRHDLISAIFAPGGEDDLVRLLARVDALKDFIESEDGGNLLVAYRRAANIVRIEEKKDKARYDGPVDENRFAEYQEHALHQSLTASVAASLDSLKDENFTGAMSALAKLRAPVDTFFDDVTVNVEEKPLRENRLRLLSEIQTSLNRIADFSRIEG